MKGRVSLSRAVRVAEPGEQPVSHDDVVVLSHHAGRGAGVDLGGGHVVDAERRNLDVSAATALRRLRPAPAGDRPVVLVRWADGLAGVGQEQVNLPLRRIDVRLVWKAPLPVLCGVLDHGARQSRRHLPVDIERLVELEVLAGEVVGDVQRSL
jgi:hypothetical protein